VSRSRPTVPSAKRTQPKAITPGSRLGVPVSASVPPELSEVGVADESDVPVFPVADALETDVAAGVVVVVVDPAEGVEVVVVEVDVADV